MNEIKKIKQLLLEHEISRYNPTLEIRFLSTATVFKFEYENSIKETKVFYIQLPDALLFDERHNLIEWTFNNALQNFKKDEVGET